MPALQTEIISTRSSLARIPQRRDYEREQSARIQQRMTALLMLKLLLVKAVALIGKTIEVIASNGIGQIEATVTNGLRLVLPERDIAFKVAKKEGARGNTYSFEVHQGEVHGPILETFGGTVANVVSLLLRVLVIKRFRLAKFLAFDEALNHVSIKHLPKTSELLKTLASSGYTIMAVTHQPILAFAADHVYSGIPGEGDEPPTLIKLNQSEIAEIRELAA
jgi:DNA repair ATPase RecN